MPTIILLDVSLSMCRSVNRLSANTNDSSSEGIDAKQLANVGIGTLLDYLAQNAQLEYTSLIVFSSLWEIKCPFTRHHESIKNGIYDLELYDKSNVINAVRGALSLKLEEWLQTGPINIILITDGQLDHRTYIDINNDKNNQQDDSAEDEDIEMASVDDFHDVTLADLDGQFNFPCKIQIVCLVSPKEPALKYSMLFYKTLISNIDNSITDCPTIIGANMKNWKQSALWLPQSDSLDISIESVENLFLKLAEMHYQPHHTNLLCGHMGSMVMVSPKPVDCSLEPLKNEFDDLKTEQNSGELSKETYVSAINKVCLYKLSDAINICGFLPLNDVASPSVVSRHLVLPVLSDAFNETQKAQQILSQDPTATQVNHLNDTTKSSSNNSIQTITLTDDTLDSHFSTKTGENRTHINQSDSSIKLSGNKPQTGSETTDQNLSKQPNFCVMLHNGLKQENMVAICIIGKSEDDTDDWFGMIHPYTDSKKRSSLMLSMFIPGAQPIPWLSKFRSMGSSLLIADLPQQIRDKINSAGKSASKSYSTNSVIWLDPESIQADVQKIVRHAKRSPDKAPHFYKELNRIRKAAISYGFYDVLFGLAAILEREMRVMMLDQTKSTNQETLNHIENVIACLRADLREDSYDNNIIPRVV